MQKAQAQAGALITHTQKQGIPQFFGLRIMGQELGRPYFLALLAEAYSEAGQVEEGVKTLTEALDIADKGGERMHQADLYRLYGELSLQQESKEERQKAKRKSQKC